MKATVQGVHMGNHMLILMTLNVTRTKRHHAGRAFVAGFILEEFFICFALIYQCIGS